MNYLSHFWLDEHRGDAAFSVGGALPDLSRLRGKGFRLKAGHVPEGASLSSTHQSLEAGIARHYAIDAHWHNADVFFALQAVTKSVLAEAGITLTRPSFAVHIGAEMVLDRALLHRDPSLATRFYTCFTPARIEEALALATLKGHQAWEPKLRIGLDAFVKRRYLEDYAHDYLAKTWPDIYQHITTDDSPCRYPTSLWLEVVDQITNIFLATVNWEELKGM